MSKPDQEYVQPIGLDVESLPKPIHFPAMFGNANPIELEIGVGVDRDIVRQVFRIVIAIRRRGRAEQDLLDDSL